MKASHREYKGAVQVHTDADGGMPMDAIVEAAKGAKLDFVVVTDAAPAAGAGRVASGWRDGVLVLVGEEMRSAKGALLAFETRQSIGPCPGPAEAAQAIRRQHGIVAGLNYPYLGLARRPSIVPPAPDPADVDLVALWSFADEFASRVRGVGALQLHARPERILQGPPREALRHWDAALREGPKPAIACVNAFARKEPLLEWREYFPFKASFRTLCTVVACRELPKADALACDFVWEALRLGRSWMANQALGDPKGFRFSYQYPAGPESYMGETAEFAKGGYVEIALPGEAEIVVRHNGSPMFWGTGSSLRFPVPTPGVVRVEARRDRRTWILSNAIRVATLEEEPRRDATVIDFT